MKISRDLSNIYLINQIIQSFIHRYIQILNVIQVNKD